MIIYKITNIINGKVYVGQTISTIAMRWKNHCSKSSRCLAISSAIEKYGRENFTIEQIDQANSFDELNKKEGYWIAQCNSVAPNGYNLKTGGNQPRLCQESINKISKANMGMKAWNEGLDKSDPRVASYVRYGVETHAYGKVGYRKGSKHTDEAKKKISEIQLGRIVSEETKKKMSESRKNSPHLAKIEKSVLCLNNNTVYKSVSEAARQLSVGISNLCNVLKGKRRSVGGYKFVYVEGVNHE